MDRRSFGDLRQNTVAWGIGGVKNFYFFHTEGYDSSPIEAALKQTGSGEFDTGKVTRTGWERKKFSLSTMRSRRVLV